MNYPHPEGLGFLLHAIDPCRLVHRLSSPFRRCCPVTVALDSRTMDQDLKGLTVVHYLNFAIHPRLGGRRLLAVLDKLTRLVSQKQERSRQIPSFILLLQWLILI
ncbi:MAG: hypothetical protein ACFFDU_04575, partial [Candidatus Thorarchaeota archaeon]